MTQPLWVVSFGRPLCCLVINTCLLKKSNTSTLEIQFRVLCQCNIYVFCYFKTEIVWRCKVDD